VPMSLPEFGGHDTGFNYYFGADPSEYDLVVSNSPYVPLADRDWLAPEVRDWEPAAALFDGGATEAMARGTLAVLADGGALVLNAAVYAVTIPLSWRYRSSAPPRKFLRTRYDIPLRALAAATVVVVVTSASHSIGSFASGMFALFPIVFCSSIVILHPRVGGKATASVMAHAQVALIGLTLAFMAVHYLAEPLGSWRALVIGLCISVAWSGMLMAVRSERMARVFRRNA